MPKDKEITQLISDQLAHAYRLTTLAEESLYSGDMDRAASRAGLAITHLEMFIQCTKAAKG
jgi:hypothetical protein